MNLKEFESSRAEFEEKQSFDNNRITARCCKGIRNWASSRTLFIFQGKISFFVAMNFFLKCMYSDTNICISGKLL